METGSCHAFFRERKTQKRSNLFSLLGLQQWDFLTSKNSVVYVLIHCFLLCDYFLTSQHLYVYIKIYIYIYIYIYVYMLHFVFLYILILVLNIVFQYFFLGDKLLLLLLLLLFKLSLLLLFNGKR